MWPLGVIPVGLAVAFTPPVLVAVRRVRREARALGAELAEFSALAAGVAEIGAASSGLRERASGLRLALRPRAPAAS